MRLRPHGDTCVLRGCAVTDQEPGFPSLNSKPAALLVMKGVRNGGVINKRGSRSFIFFFSPGKRVFCCCGGFYLDGNPGFAYFGILNN